MESELRKLDARIAREVFGCEPYEYTDESTLQRRKKWAIKTPPPRGVCGQIIYQDHELPFYTTSDADALAALDKVGLDYEMAGRVGEGHCCKIIIFNGGEIVLEVCRATEETRPLAICRAIEKFLDHQKESRNAKK